MSTKDLHTQAVEALKAAKGLPGGQEDVENLRRYSDEQLRFLAAYWSQHPRPEDPEWPPKR